MKKTTWQIMNETADADEKRELDLIALKSLKDRHKRFKDTPLEERKNLMRDNLNIRKEAQKILKTYEETNKFMYAKDFDHYLKKVDPKPFEKIVDNLKKPMTSDTLKSQSVNSQPSEEEKILQNINKNRKGLDTIVYYNTEDAAKPRPPKTITPTEDFKTPESEFQRVPEFIEKNMKPDPDLNKGIGSVEYPNAVTLNAVKNLKE